jgi:hypothetical protein
MLSGKGSCKMVEKNKGVQGCKLPILVTLAHIQSTIVSATGWTLRFTWEPVSHMFQVSTMITALTPYIQTSYSLMTIRQNEHRCSTVQNWTTWVHTIWSKNSGACGTCHTPKMLEQYQEPVWNNCCKLYLWLLHSVAQQLGKRHTLSVDKASLTYHVDSPNTFYRAGIYDICGWRP